MLRQKTVSIFLATSVAVATACGGGSKSTDTETMPVASSAEEPIGETHETVQTEPMPGVDDEGRQNVSGTMGQPGTGGTHPGTVTEPATGSDPATGTGTGVGTGIGAETQAALGAPGVLAMLGAASEHEIAAARLATEKSKNASVKKYAKTIVDHHTQMQRNGEKLATKLSVTPEPNAEVESLRTESQAALERLRALEGAEFDRAFVDQMIQDHEKVLSLIDDRITPATTGQPELASMIEKDRPKIQGHLDEARKLQTRLNK